MYDQDYESQTFMGQKADNSSYNPRLGFVKKVYGIISVQLIITTIFVVLAQSRFAAYLQDCDYYSCGPSSAAMTIFWICLVATIIISIMISCYTSIARTVPTNYILLFLFTLCESYLVGLVTTFYDPPTVILAAGLTACLTITLTIYACTTKTDFTLYGGILWIVGWGFFAVSILFGYFTMGDGGKYYNMMTCCLAVFGICLYGVYLIYDTQLIMGGGRYKLSLDDYIIGALVIYIDIIALFLRILQLLGAARR